MDYKVVVTREAEEDFNIFHELQDYESKMY